MDDEPQAGGGGGINLGGHKIKTQTLLIAGGVAVVAFLVVRSGSGGGTSGSVVVGAQGPAGPAGTDLSAELAALSAELNKLTEWEKTIRFKLHVVPKGETWESLAKQLGITVQQLKFLNQTVAGQPLYAGESLTIPMPKS